MKLYESTKFQYDWSISCGYPATGVEYHGSKVFSCFACGGGSTMGYKLAGYDVIGMNEIDPKVGRCYLENHSPGMSFIEDIRDFNKRESLPNELFNLDVLDGSPPCSSFSMAGNREKDWGKEKKFNEGQAEQVLDTLFFDFIELAARLQPKTIIVENVKGILMGSAKDYVRKIYSEMDKAGYICKHFLLNASKMGVPQERERVFFIAVRKDLAEPILVKQDMFSSTIKLNIDESQQMIKLTEFATFKKKTEKQNYSESRYGDVLLNLNKPAPTIVTRGRYWASKESLIDDNTIIKSGSFPGDYNFLDVEPQYLIGMSVPPVMMANIAHNVYEQILTKIKQTVSV